MSTLAPSNNRHHVLRDRWEIPSVDQVIVEERAGTFAKRSVKTSAKLQGLISAISMMDLTTLEGKDTPGRIASLCRKVMQPLDPRYETLSREFQRESCLLCDRISDRAHAAEIEAGGGSQCRWRRRRQDRHGHRSRRFSGGRIWSYERTTRYTD
jgi:hypothetical protein